MNRSSLKQQAKAQIRGKIGILFVIHLIIAVLSLASGLLPVAGWLIVTPAFSLSSTMIYLHLGRGETKVGDAFSGFGDFWAAFKVDFLTTLFTILWSLLFLIPGIIKAISYSLSMYVLAENPGMSASECIDRSKKLTDGHKADLFVLALSFIGWGILVALTFGIASIYVTPYLEATFANAYRALKADTVRHDDHDELLTIEAY